MFRKDAKRTEGRRRCETLVPVIFPKTDFQALTVAVSFTTVVKRKLKRPRETALPANYLQYCDAD